MRAVSAEKSKKSGEVDESEAGQGGEGVREGDAEGAESSAAHGEGATGAEEGASPEGEGEGEASAAEGEGEERARRENRRERRRKRKVGAEDEMPRDRNARVRAQHAKKRAPDEAELPPLTTGEMIDDVLARTVHAAGKWASANANWLQGVVLAAVLGGAAWGVYSWRKTSTSETASRDLMAGVAADRAPVTDAPPAKPERADDEEAPLTFKTGAARAEAALGGYRKAKAVSPGSGTSLLAQLGEAGLLLDQGRYDEALASYREVKASPLAAADPDVRGRAIEGAAFAIEGKGDSDGALKAFKELETVTGQKGFKELGMYHQARLLAAKGDRESALKLVKETRERLQTSGEARQFAYLVGVLDDLHRSIDPASAPKRSIGGADKAMGGEELQRLQQELMRQMQKAQEQGEHP